MTCRTTLVYDGNDNRLLKIEASPGVEYVTLYIGTAYEWQFYTSDTPLSEPVNGTGDVEAWQRCHTGRQSPTDIGFTI